MMQNVFRSLCLAIGLFGVALPAQAADYWHPYVGAGVGDFIIDAGPGSKAAFGGYGMVGNDFNDNVGVEVRFGTTGKTGGTLIVPVGFSQPDTVGPVTLTTPTPAKVSIDWFVAYLLKLQYPFTNGFRVYGVIGATTMKSRFTFASPVPPFTYAPTAHATTTTFSYGGGFDYGLNDQWRVGVDATVYSNKATTTPNANFSGLDVWGITATARYGF
ncbi:MAG TPA: outer membrane beta-barrel protein [Mariprofundaceae bacterium]|nr:outer membrane beta-barrel protein [Mariprofundaceae bacterium]